MPETPPPAPIDADALCNAHLGTVEALIRDVLRVDRAALEAADARVAGAGATDCLVHVYGPGGHSNLAAQEIFYRAGGLNIRTVARLVARGVEPPIWQSGNADGRDAANARALGHLRQWVPAL